MLGSGSSITVEIIFLFGVLSRHSPIRGGMAMAGASGIGISSGSTIKLFVCWYKFSSPLAKGAPEGTAVFMRDGEKTGVHSKWLGWCGGTWQ